MTFLSQTDRRALDTLAGVLHREPGATTARIAQALGVSRATLHRKFPSRAHVVAAALDASANAVDIALTRVEVDDQAGIDDLVRALWPVAQRFSFLAHLPEAETHPQAAAIMNRLGDIVADGRRRDLWLTDMPDAWIVEALVALLAGAARAVELGTVAPRDAPALIARTLKDGVGRRGRSTGPDHPRPGG